MVETIIEVTVVPVSAVVINAGRGGTAIAVDRPHGLREQDKDRLQSARGKAVVCAVLAMLAAGFATVVPSRAGMATTAAQLNRQELGSLRAEGAAPLRHRPRASRARATPAQKTARPQLPSVEQNGGDSIAATPALVRQVQFLLLSIGSDPGPIDGVPRQLTNTAVRQFERESGLPEADLVRDGRISTALLDHLRAQASTVLLGPQKPALPPPAAASPAVSAPAAAASPTPPVSPPVDRFAACPFTAADFRIGGMQYTPQSFLKMLGGSTAEAVATLKDRLQEARRLALQIGGPALMEVQRQAKVVDYLQCRLKIEEASASKNE